MIFNTSLETSIFPVLRKIYQVVAIYKEGDESEKSNYHPASVLPVTSSLFERFVHNELYQHLHSDNLLAKEQSGFCTLNYTLTCLLKSTDDWHSGLDKEGLLV